MSAVDWVTGAISILGVIVGGLLTWIATTRVATRTAKREAYARFLAAVDVYGQAVVRIGQLGAPPVPDASGPNEAIAGRDLSMMTFKLSGPPDNWEEKVREFWTVRRDLFVRARRETGAKPLPEGFFYADDQGQGRAITPP